MIIDNPSKSFIVDAGMDELKSLDEAFNELGYERLEDRNFFKDVHHRIVASARRQSSEAIDLLRTIVALSLIH
jgi:hypothetical protein